MTTTVATVDEDMTGTMMTETATEADVDGMMVCIHARFISSLTPTDEAVNVLGRVCLCVFVQGVKYSVEASSSINTGVEMTRSHLAD